jgi:hypothetical protein
MTLDDALQDLHALELDLQSYERKYGLLSETFYLAYSKGEEPEDDTWVMDWAEWAGTYKVWQTRLNQVRTAIRSLQGSSDTRGEVIRRTARHERIPLPA